MAFEIDKIAALLQQMGNSTRLEIVRLLVRAGPSGMPVGDIQAHLDIPASTLSHHVAKLCGVGLVIQTRESTTLYCCVDYAMIDGIISFLSDECCIANNIHTQGAHFPASDTA